MVTISAVGAITHVQYGQCVIRSQLCCILYPVAHAQGVVGGQLMEEEEDVRILVVIDTLELVDGEDGVDVVDVVEVHGNVAVLLCGGIVTVSVPAPMHPQLKQPVTGLNSYPELPPGQQFTERTGQFVVGVDANEDVEVVDVVVDVDVYVDVDVEVVKVEVHVGAAVEVDVLDNVGKVDILKLLVAVEDVFVNVPPVLLLMGVDMKAVVEVGIVE